MVQIEEITEDKLNIIKGVFMDFLNDNGHKRTEERMVILEEIYSLRDHFDVEELHLHLRLKNYKISMATIYNNMKLYLDAGLVNRHRFGKGMTQYKKCYFRGDHHHIILTDSGKVMEFKDDRIEKIKDSIEKTFGIKVERHSLYFYAKCCDSMERDLNSAGSMTFQENSKVQ